MPAWPFYFHPFHTVQTPSKRLLWTVYINVYMYIIRIHNIILVIFPNENYCFSFPFDVYSRAFFKGVRHRTSQPVFVATMTAKWFWENMTNLILWWQQLSQKPTIISKPESVHYWRNNFLEFESWVTEH